MRYLHPDHDAHLELSLDDVFIVPQLYEGTSRLDVDITPTDFAGGSHPIVSANMNAVTGKRMAETMARYGGLGILPQDMSLQTVERIVKHIKTADVRYDTPVVVEPKASIRDVLGLIRKRAHDTVIVVDAERRPVGVITHADLRDHDQYTPAELVMTRDPITIPVGTSNREAFMSMDRERFKALPVVDDEGRIVGIITKADAVRLELMQPSLNDRGELLVAAAVGISAQAAEQASALVGFGVDAIVLDTAHGHQRRMLDAIRAVKSALPSTVPVIAGNVCTAEGTRALLEAGADVVKVNVGPGAMCTTRMQTGVGRPTFTSVRACAEEARRHDRHVWADGGVRHARDIALYLAAGASRVMVGTALAGTYESPGDIKEDREGHLYKENYGMASARAVKFRTSNLDAFEQAKKGFFREGISSSRIYMREGQESVGDILLDYLTGLQSAFTYTGAKSAPEFQERAIIGVQTASGFGEGKPHGRVRR